MRMVFDEGLHDCRFLGPGCFLCNEISKNDMRGHMKGVSVNSKSFLEL